MRRGWRVDVERRLHLRVLGVGETSKERDVKNEFEVKINRIHRRHIRESIEWFAKGRFLLPDERNYFVYRRLVKDPGGLHIKRAWAS